MRILLDQGTPAPLRRELSGHQVLTAYEMGWAQLKNGELLTAAEAEFEIFITTDQNLRYQQKPHGQTARHSRSSYHQLAQDPSPYRGAGRSR